MFKQRSRLVIIIIFCIAFQSCDIFSPFKESKRRQKVLEFKIDSLKQEHVKLNKDIETGEHILDMMEYSDSVFLNEDTTASTNSK